jgi:hypothetical protein
MLDAGHSILDAGATARLQNCKTFLPHNQFLTILDAEGQPLNSQDAKFKYNLHRGFLSHFQFLQNQPV